MCQRILKIMAGGSKKFWKRSGKPSVCSEKILFGKEFFLGSFRWTSLKSLTNSQAATCHHLFVALGSTHHFPVGASIRTHRAARSQGKTNTGGKVGNLLCVLRKFFLEKNSFGGPSGGLPASLLRILRQQLATTWY